MDIKADLKELCFEAAGIGIRILCCGDDWQGVLPDSDMLGFTGKGTEDLMLNAYYGSLPEVEPGKLVFDSGGNWRLLRQEEEWVFLLQSPAVGPEPYALARINNDFSRGDIYLRPIEDDIAQNDTLPAINPIEYPLDEVLMLHKLALGKGVILHSCGVDFQGHGLLFCGVSGSGKSTIANLWKKEKSVRILSDDRIIVRRVEGRLWMYGTPWHGDAQVCSPKRVPLEKIFFLKHAKDNSLSKLGAIDALSRLMVCAFVTFWHKPGMEFSLSFCAELAENIDCFELSFTPKTESIDFIKNQL